jgi:hypothetical protein
LIFEIISFVAFSMGVIGLWVAGKYRAGWLIGVFATIPWTIYAVHLDALAILANAWVFCGINLRNYFVNK